jgi:hypothetical protein
VLLEESLQSKERLDPLRGRRSAPRLKRLAARPDGPVDLLLGGERNGGDRLPGGGILDLQASAVLGPMEVSVDVVTKRACGPGVGS